MLRDTKYLLAYILPLSGFAAVYLGGIGSYLSIIIGFIIIPIIDSITPRSDKNFTAQEEQSKLSNYFFDILLYLNVPLLYALIGYFFYAVANSSYETYEIVGLLMSIGLVIGTTGINVAHELGHRVTKFEQFLAKMLLLPALYLHFFIEHNRGHHKNVATDKDPASSRLNESIYAFWVRSTVYSWISAWNLEADLLKKKSKPVFSLYNQMLRFQLMQLGYLLIVFFIGGLQLVFFTVAIAVFGFLMLESVNYIEHYGLRRRKLASGRYEKVLPIHSWNSDHELGRIMLYELTRHSDHHYKATRKYQVLRHFEESPQLPQGYPGSILMAMVPPLWFKVMNKRVAEHQNKLTAI